MREFWQDFRRNFGNFFRASLAFLGWLFFLCIAAYVSVNSSGTVVWLAWLSFVAFAAWRLSVGRARYDAWQRELAIKFHMSTRNVQNHDKYRIASYWSYILKCIFFVIYLIVANLLLLYYVPSLHGPLLFLVTLLLPFFIDVVLTIMDRRRRQALDSQQNRT